MKFFDMPFQVLFPSKAWRFSAVLLLSGIELYIRLLIYQILNGIFQEDSNSTFKFWICLL